MKRTLIVAAVLALAVTAGLASDAVNNLRRDITNRTALTATTTRTASAIVATTPAVIPTSKSAAFTNGFKQVLLTGVNITWYSTNPVPAAIAENMDRRHGYIWRTNFPGAIRPSVKPLTP